MKTICQLCDKEVSLTGLRVHTKSKHKMPIKNYKHKFGKPVPVEEIFHECKICRNDLYLDSDFIAHHLKTHSITHREYNQKNMKMVGTSKKKIKLDNEEKKILVSEKEMEAAVQFSTIVNNLQSNAILMSFEEKMKHQIFDDLDSDEFIKAVALFC